jgi:octaprenyl-diphosphate synthase
VVEIMNFSNYTKDLKKVDKIIEKSFLNNSQQIKEIFKKSYLFKGKKIRPLISIISYRLFDNSSGDDLDSIYTLAAGVELLHCASLIHDDINDNNQLRRGFPTINSIYGNTMAQILGDLLFVKSFELCGKFDNEIVQQTAQSCSNIAEGEILQLQNRDNVDIKKEIILKIEEYKTASVFGTSAYCGAFLAKANMREKKLLYNFGINFGMAFQLVDDILDYTGSPNQIGKNIYQDITEGKITLPLYYILNDPTTTNKDNLYKKLKSLSIKAQSKMLKSLFKKTGALEKTYDDVKKYCIRAKSYLKSFDSKELDRLVDVFSNRTY